MITEQLESKIATEASSANPAEIDTGNLSIPLLKRILSKKKNPVQERYRFHFHAEKCMGCSSCAVACNEQNDNSSDIRWRKVTEMEWGAFPHTGRFFLSMACNHCEDPSCLKGCPTNSYKKDPSGIIVHNQSSCIGCQYCTWNCPYSAPLYSPDLGIVTKCNMCYDRLKDGGIPACAESCPVDAIEIEKVSSDDLREEALAGDLDAPGLPPSSITGSSTKITLPEDAKNDQAKKAGLLQDRKHYRHSSLILFLSLSQLAVGTALMNFAAGLLFPDGDAAGHDQTVKSALIASGSAFLSLFIALFHLGRPLRAYRALLGIGHSWISREILFFSLFSMFSFLQGAMIYSGTDSEVMNVKIQMIAGFFSVISGLLAVYSSAKIYMVPARPVWNTRSTIVRFFTSAVLLGSSAMALASLKVGYFSEDLFSFMLVMVLNASMFQVMMLLYLTSRDDKKIKNGFYEGIRILREYYSRQFSFRLGSLFLGGFIIPAYLHYLILNGKSLPEYTYAGILFLFAVILFSEFTGKFLFFVTSAGLKSSEGLHGPDSDRLNSKITALTGVTQRGGK